MLASVQGVLLPGSKFDVDPQRYGEAREPECAEDDPARTAADELLLQDAFNLRKPILAICHGAQNLNVWRGGDAGSGSEDGGQSSARPRSGEGAPGGDCGGIAVEWNCAGAGSGHTEEGGIEVNSSHHQAIRTPGDNLRVSAVSPGDGVIEAVELDAADHFVVGVQWHPERTYGQSGFSRAIFSAFVQAATEWEPPKIESAKTEERELNDGCERDEDSVACAFDGGWSDAAGRRDCRSVRGLSFAFSSLE